MAHRSSSGARYLASVTCAIGLALSACGGNEGSLGETHEAINSDHPLQASQPTFRGTPAAARPLSSSESIAISEALTAKRANDPDVAVVDVYITGLGGDAVDASTLLQIKLCSIDRCFEQEARLGGGRLNSTENGDAPKVARFTMEPLRVTKVVLNSSNSTSTATTEATLPEELDLINVSKRAAVLVSATNRTAANHLAIASAAGTYQAEGGDLLFYNPAIGVRKNIGHGASISIPPEAHPISRVFTVGVVDNGSTFPRVDIWPNVDLSKGAEVRLPKIQRKAGDQITPTPPNPSLSTEAARARDQDELSVEIHRTTTIHDGVPQGKHADEIKRKMSVNIMAAAPADACANLVALPANQNIINTDIQIMGFVNINWCENQPPYVHIGLAQANDWRVKTEVVFGTRSDPSWTNVLDLQRIDKYSNFTLLINGFTWAGGEGTSSGQTGRAKGYVKGIDLNGRTGRIVAGGNSPGGSSNEMCAYGLPSGYFCWPATSDGNKRVFDYALDQRTLRNWQTISSPSVNWSQSGIAMSSSTSIVNQGVCTTDTLESRWSAVGTTPTGRLVYMSSTSSSTTSADELCKVFKAFGVTNAIRLDGGPSASMMIDNRLKNPLSGLYWIKYGNSRYVANALGSYQSNFAPPGYNY